MNFDSQNLEKLAVAKLRALCKEYGLAGYSKLAKPALVAKLRADVLTSKAPRMATADQSLYLQSKNLTSKTQNNAEIVVR
jgi:hypothetical protein